MAGKIRPFNMIRHFTATGHQVTVCSLARSSEEAREGRGNCAPLRALRDGHCQRAGTDAAHGCAAADAGAVVDGILSIRRISSGRSTSCLRVSVSISFRALSSVAQYVARVTDIPKILDFSDMDSQKWLEYANYKRFPLSLGYRLEGIKMMREEKRLARASTSARATPAEWETLERYGVAVDTDWFPNGVDANFFKPDGGWLRRRFAELYRSDGLLPQSGVHDRVLRETLPLIQAKRPQAKLVIVGADPTPAMRELGQLPGVTVTGSVPDVRPYILRSCAMVATLNIARGTQNKILEAMAMGVPVVTSPAGAGGVDAENGAHFLVADTPVASAECALRLIGDATERGRLAKAGRERMLSHHEWSASMRRLDDIVQRCVIDFARGRPRGAA